jgi:hypothetical protein
MPDHLDETMSRRRRKSRITKATRSRFLGFRVLQRDDSKLSKDVPPLSHFFTSSY